MVTKVVKKPVVTKPVVKPVVKPVAKPYTGSLLPISEAFVKSFPNDAKLQAAYKAFAAGNFTDFETLFLGSDFYKNNASVAQQRIKAKAEQPGAYSKTFEAYKVTLRNRLTAKGVTPDPAYFDSKEFENVYLSGTEDTQFDTLFLGSDFYKNNSAIAQERIQAKAQQPGAYKNLFDAYKLSTRNRLIAKGVTLDDTYFNSPEFETSYLNGMEDDQLDQEIVKAHKTGTIGGAIGGGIQSLKSYANSFGVGTKQDWQKESENLFAGITTEEDIKAKIRQDAISAYPSYADQINKGISLDSLASAYKSTMASVLEVDPDTISYSNPILARALQSTDAQNKPNVTPLWQFERQLKQTKQWEYTDNARSTMDSMGLRVLKDMGLA